MVWQQSVFFFFLKQVNFGNEPIFVAYTVTLFKSTTKDSSQNAVINNHQSQHELNYNNNSSQYVNTN